ncbi:AI-2E family transporter [Chloroflexota bacterium]
MDRINLRTRIFFALAFLILLILSFNVIRPFLTVIIFTLILVIVLKPAYNNFLNRNWMKGRKRLAATITLIVFVVVIFIPLFLLVKITVSQLSGIVENFDPANFSSLLESLEAFINSLPFTGEFTIDVERLKDILLSAAEAVASFLGGMLVSLVTSIPTAIFNAIIFLVLYMTLMPEYDNLINKMEETSPLGQEITSLYYRKTAAMVNSLVYGIFLIAIIQGVAMGFFYWWAGVENVFLLILVSIAFAILPLVGISYLTLFLAFIFILQGEYSSAAIVLFGFYGVVNWIDVLLRPRLISKEAYINFALILLGILGGMLWAGFLGLFIGPTVLMLLVTTIQIYQERFAREDGGVIKNYASSTAKVGDSDEEPKG